MFCYTIISGRIKVSIYNPELIGKIPIINGVKQQGCIWSYNMESGQIITTDETIKAVLEQARTIAIIGLSPNAARDSNMVARYLKKQGYRIIPVRPAQKEILEEKAYSSLDDIEGSVDIVNVFRNPSQIAPHAREALRIMPRVFWMQLNIENQEAADILTAAGIDVVMNRCIKVEHERLCKQKNI